MARDPYPPDLVSVRTGIAAMVESHLQNPYSAMVWNCAGGGKDNYPPDRELCYLIEEATLPSVLPSIVAHNEAFLRRAVKEVWADGITQFIDLGPGLPVNFDNAYTEVLARSSNARIVYVDNDPFVVSRTWQFITDHRQGRSIEADIFNPDCVLSNDVILDFLDWSEPIALVCTAVLHEHPGPIEDLAAIMQTYVDRLPPGSYIVLSHLLEPEDDETKGLIKSLEEALPQAIGSFRPRKEIETLFAGQPIRDPGVVSCQEWRSDEEGSGWSLIAGGVAQKPHGADQTRVDRPARRRRTVG